MSLNSIITTTLNIFNGLVNFVFNHLLTTFFIVIGIIILISWLKRKLSGEPVEEEVEEQI